MSMVIEPFGRAAAVTGAGLVLLLVSLPFADVRLHGLLGELAGPGGTFLWNRDDAWTALLVAVAAGMVVLAGVLRRPMVMGWALVPAVVVVGWALLVYCDIQLDTSYVTGDVGTRMNRDRSLGPGAWLKLAGMLLVVAGLAVAPVERWRSRVTSDSA